jgi:AbrB family looped-hinge helix DNA binding protein
MAQSVQQIEVKVGPLGRLVIPAVMRHALGIDAGSTLIARVEDGRLVLEKREAIEERIWNRFRAIPPDVCLADELIQERRQIARLESAE